MTALLYIIDILMSDAEIWPATVSALYQDVMVDVAYNVTLQLSGQAFPGGDPPYLAMQLSLTDQPNDPTPLSFPYTTWSPDTMWSTESLSREYIHILSIFFGNFCGGFTCITLCSRNAQVRTDY